MERLSLCDRGDYFFRSVGKVFGSNDIGIGFGYDFAALRDLGSYEAMKDNTDYEGVLDVEVSAELKGYRALVAKECEVKGTPVAARLGRDCKIFGLSPTASITTSPSSRHVAASSCVWTVSHDTFPPTACRCCFSIFC